MNIALWLSQRASDDPKQPALYTGTELVADYGQFDRVACEVSAGLAIEGDRGVYCRKRADGRTGYAVLGKYRTLQTSQAVCALGQLAEK